MKGENSKPQGAIRRGRALTPPPPSLSAKAVHERFSRWPESRTGALWLCRPTKTFIMWRQAEGVSRPSQRSVAPGGFLQRYPSRPLGIGKSLLREWISFSTRRSFSVMGEAIEASKRDLRNCALTSLPPCLAHKIGGALLTPRVNLTPQTWTLVLSSLLVLCYASRRTPPPLISLPSRHPPETAWRHP